MAAVVRQKKSGKVTRMLVQLNRNGNGSRTVPFNRRQTTARLRRGGQRLDPVRLRLGDFTYSCRGIPAR